MVHQAGIIPVSLCGTKQLGVFLLPHVLDARISPAQGYRSVLNLPEPILY